ncbi:MAG: DUF6108 family protein [Alloprevotella sp.]|nr:DUF6108 family protein [Bacteroidales bacterium]MDY3942901.1 DUF6108 family protein [Alloprevotella sp.]
MRQFLQRTLLMLLLLMGVSTMAMAQKGLQVERLFAGKVVPRQKMTETFVKGQRLSSYRLTLFRSLRFTATEAERQQVEALVRNDAKTATSKEVDIRNGQWQYALCQLPPTHTQRYLCYQRTGNSLLVVYLEGSATLSELKNMFI